MASKINVYSLGTGGVNVDSSPIHLQDNELRKAQNMTTDPLGVGGGLRKRQGLVAFNGSAASGSIVGGIGVPLLNKQAGTHTFYFANVDPGAGATWQTSTNEWASVLSVVTPSAARSTNASPATRFKGSNPFYGHPSCVFGNRLYFAGNDFTDGTTDPTIRSWDGTTEHLVAKVTNSSAHSHGVVTMLSSGGAIYVAMLDSGTDDTDFSGRVLSLDPSTGQLTLIGKPTATGHVPYALCRYGDKLWLGTFRKTHSNTARIYWIRPGLDTDWTLDTTLAANQYGVTQLVTYAGELYASTAAASGTAALVMKRTTLGVWSTSDTSASTSDDNAYYAMAAFGTNLYASNAGASILARIRKFDGTTWSTVSTATSSGLLYLVAYVHNSKLYFASAHGAPTAADYLIRSANGTSWTLLGASLAGGEDGANFQAIVT